MNPPAPGVRKSTARLLWALFSLFIVYGTTIPFSFRLGPGGLGGLFGKILWHPLGSRNGDISSPDLLQNILLFIPFGFLGYIALVEKRSRLKRVIIILMGAGLSAFVEFLQLFADTRWTALSDVIFNTLGTAVGVYAGMRLKNWVMAIKGRADLRRWFDSPSAYPALVFLGLAAIGTWQPFDFALDYSTFVYKAKVILKHPFDLSWPNDELATFIRYLLATLFACRLAREAGLPRPALLATLAMLAAAGGLEATQLIIRSRAPSFQDALTSALGVAAGAVSFGLPSFRVHPLRWGAVGILAIGASAVLAGLYPFEFTSVRGGFNWIPFMSEYAKTTFTALGNFIESSLTFLPLGFLLGYFFHGTRRAAAAALALSMGTAFAVELAQAWVVGRHADITDVIGAAAGSLAGSLALSRGWKAYRDYTAPGDVQ